MSPELKEIIKQGEGLVNCISKFLSPLKVAIPITLDEWANKYFYLSKESSYSEGIWECTAYQKGIMKAISNEDIPRLFFMKSARVGYTKMLLAGIGYFIEHKKRNIAIWHPTENDAQRFTKTELDTAIRDCPILDKELAKLKGIGKTNSTLFQKQFKSSMLYIKAGKSANSYRAISVDVAMLDEIDAFDRNTDKEGDPVSLASTRTEGARFPKLIVGSTPRVKNESLIEENYELAQFKFKFHIKCIHCGSLQHLVWGIDKEYGLKITEDIDDTHYVCISCKEKFYQHDYFSIANDGIWRDENGFYLDNEGYVNNTEGNIVKCISLAFHLWTAYSPFTTWVSIAEKYVNAKNDNEKLKVFYNTVLGESWEDGGGTKLSVEDIMSRTEIYELEVPKGVRYLTAGIDVQDDRIEYQVDGWGYLEERWTLDYKILFGDLNDNEIWERLSLMLKGTYPGYNNVKFPISISCIDHGGHFSKEVEDFSKINNPQRVIPIKGSSTYGYGVINMPRKKNAAGIYLTMIGTDAIKEIMYSRLGIKESGGGYWHFKAGDPFDKEYFTMLTNEERTLINIKGKHYFKWYAKGRRQEPWDCSVYSMAGIRILQKHFGVDLTRKDI